MYQDDTNVCITQLDIFRAMDVVISFKVEHLSSSLVFSGIRVTRSLALCVCFVDSCLSFCTFSFGQCVGCSSAIYAFRLTLLYLHTLLAQDRLWTGTIIWRDQTDKWVPTLLFFIIESSIVIHI